MFTGIVQEQGKIESIVKKNKQELNLRIRTKAPFFKNVSIGESVLVDGVCLTVVKSDDFSIDVDVMIPTFEVTNFKNIVEGTNVHLEKALLLNDRLNGHIVTGHVDDIGIIKKVEEEQETTLLTIEYSDDRLLKEIVEKGSISIDGVSLTIIKISNHTFTVGLIPTTIKLTHLGNLKLGEIVNIETDIIGKYVALQGGRNER